MIKKRTNQLITFIQHFFKIVIDFLYPPFQKLMPKQLFRYAFSGAFANAVDIIIYFVAYNYVLDKNNISFNYFTLSPHVAAILIAFCCSFPIGFFMQKYITFTNSNLRGRVQLARYMMIVAVCIILNIFFIKLFVEHFHIFPTIAKILTTIIVVIFSYFTQRNFSFKEAKLN